MAAHQRLERLKVACLRRRDKEPITGLDYHCVAVVRAIVNVMDERARDHQAATLSPS